MRYRPRWALLGLGALIVVLLFTFPLWRNSLTGRGPVVEYPLADDGQRRVLRSMADQNAAATAYAALQTVVPIPTESQPPVPGNAQTILEGEFTERDALHRAEGKVSIYRFLENDTVLLRLDPFKVTNGPQLVLYLAGTENPTNREELSQGATEYRLGPLKGTDGAQQYNIPKELRLDRYRSVVIYSEALQTVYSTAPLK